MIHTLRFTLAAAAFAAAVLLAVAAPAGEGRGGPLATVTVDDPETIRQLWSSPLAEALGLADGDFSLRPPGGDMYIRSFADLLAGWEDSQAVDLWLRVDQEGGSVASSALSMGWNWPAGFVLDAEEARAWLDEHGLEWRGETRLGDSVDNLSALRLGKGSANDDDFADLGPGVNAVIATRPLVGYASLVSGVDIRGVASRFRLRIPPLAEARVWPADGFVGVAALLENVLPSDEVGNAGVVEATARLTRDFDNRLVANPPFAAALLEVEDALNPIGLSLATLLPKTLTFGWTLDDEGGADWQAAGLVAYDAFAQRQYKRLWAWLDLAATVTKGLKVEPQDIGGREVRRIAYRGREAYIGLIAKGAGDDQAFLMISPRRDDFADGAPGLTQHAEPYAVAWDLRLSERERDMVVRRWKREAANAGFPFDENAFRNALPQDEVGGMWIDGRTVLVSSPRGLAILAAPALEDILRLVLKGIL